MDGALARKRTGPAGGGSAGPGAARRRHRHPRCRPADQRPGLGRRCAEPAGGRAAALCRAAGQDLGAAGTDQRRVALRTPPSEAALMANALLQDFGVPTRWQEGLSRTTWENATLSAPQLREAGVRRVVLVTQAWHMQRARWSFERQGFEVIPAPVGFLGGANLRPFGGWLPEAQAFWQSGMLLNEAIGLVGYRLFYR
nr:YdcF family protein [Pseudomonas aeruginosa]